MATITQQTHSYVQRKFHTLCTNAGLSDDEKRETVQSFGHYSTKDMSVDELLEACSIIEGLKSKRYAEMDKWRKRVIASINGYLQLTGGERNISIIKSIACRATQQKDFNKIPKQRLINIYSAFTNKQKDFKQVNGFVVDDLFGKTLLN